MRKFPYPTQSHLQLVICSIIGHVPSVQKNVAIRNLPCQIIIVGIGDADDTDTVVGHPETLIRNSCDGPRR